ncbi:unnamed protein product [Clavelina lepadiformis]|uniref:Uncharacterized protein n=1 Tax=Clavelina lepadiformis TaxID=159417 RepID=A0ABP0FXA8_CLALP
MGEVLQLSSSIFARAEACFFINEALITTVTSSVEKFLEAVVTSVTLAELRLWLLGGVQGFSIQEKLLGYLVRSDASMLRRRWVTVMVFQVFRHSCDMASISSSPAVKVLATKESLGVGDHIAFRDHSSAMLS